MSHLYDLTMRSITGEDVNLADYRPPTPNY